MIFRKSLTVVPHGYETMKTYAWENLQKVVRVRPVLNKVNYRILHTLYTYSRRKIISLQKKLKNVCNIKNPNILRTVGRLMLYYRRAV